MSEPLLRPATPDDDIAVAACIAESFPANPKARVDVLRRRRCYLRQLLASRRIDGRERLGRTPPLAADEQFARFNLRLGCC